MSQPFPHFSEWIGVWAMEPTAFAALAHAAQKLDLQQHLDQHARLGNVKEISYRQDFPEERVAVIHIRGPMQKHVASFGDGTSTVIARREIMDAASDDSIESIILLIESPGGSVSGTLELAQTVSNAKNKKPVYAYIEDIGASAAYWVASQATSITSNAMAMVGSIGTYGVVVDSSKRAEMDGIKVHVISSGVSKGNGVPGTEVKEQYLEEMQKLIDDRNALFLRSVGEGRLLTDEYMKSLSTGQVWIASEAKAKGLIDSVASFQDFFEALTFSRRGSMPTSKEIKAACPGCDDTFVVTSLEQDGATIDSIRKAWMEEQAIRIMQLTETVEMTIGENQELQDKIAALAAKQSGSGVDPLEDEREEDKGPKVGYFEKIRIVAAEQGLSRRDAQVYVNKNYPHLRAEIIEQANAR